MDVLLNSIGVLTTVKVLVPLFFSIYTSLVYYVGVIQESADLLKLNDQTFKVDTFDYIIVGGGTAGCVLANRLSANLENTVLLLEQGGDPHPFMQVPILAGSNLAIGTPPLAQPFTTTVQRQTCGNQGICRLFGGYGLGGVSNINSLAITRGSPQIFDAWANLTEDERWRFDNVLPFFKKSEDYHGYYQPMNGTHHSTGGEWYVGNVDRADPNPAALNNFFEAAAAKGFPLIDINNGEEAKNSGYLHFDVNIKQGQRWSTYKAFLEPALNRPNLVVHRYAHVTKVHLDSRRIATGVTFTKNGKSYTAHARKETILSAGTIGSAKLLLLSGIGPSVDLKPLGILPRVNLPVGSTFYDHVGVQLRYSINTTLFFYPQRDTELNDVMEYVTSGSGYFGKIISTFGAVFTKSSLEKAKSNSYPDLEFTYGNVFRTPPPPATETAKDFFNVFSFLAAPLSVGKLMLKSNNPLDDPIVDPNYLDASEDMERIIEGIEIIVDLIESFPGFQALGVKTTPRPACMNMTFKTNEYWRCHTRDIGQSGGQHFVGTCPMGVDRQKGVVDSQLRVFGVQRLRVIDASVMPLIPNAHTMAPTVMVAEVGANLVLDENAKRIEKLTPLTRGSTRQNLFDSFHSKVRS